MLNKIEIIKKLIIRSGFHYFRRSQISSPFWISVNGKKCRVYANPEIDAICNFCELILADCYEILKKPRSLEHLIIVDIGANVGMFSKICSLKFPNAEIYAYEPNPKSVEWLKINSQETNIKVYPFAVWHSSGKVRLNIDCNSIDVHVSETGNLEVESVCADQIADGKVIDILKLDCEGAEWQILKYSSILMRSKYLYMEYHLTEGHSLKELENIITECGHKITKISPKDGCNNEFGMLWSECVNSLVNLSNKKVA